MYGRYVALREKKGVTDYRVAVETGLQNPLFQIGKVVVVFQRRTSFLVWQSILMYP